MRDRDPIDNWTDGRMTLMGDAAHPMLQYLAQGACQAIEDAECLAKHIEKNGDDNEAAFQAYQNERLPKTTKVQTTARFFGEVLHATDPITRALRNRILRARSANDTSDVEWLYLKEKKKIKQ